jgi:SAM-dependent methyltransferase
MCDPDSLTPEPYSDADSICSGEFYTIPPSDHRWRYEHAARRLKALDFSGLVVDIGCGSGYGSEILMDSGFDVMALDHNPAARAAVMKRGFSAVETEWKGLSIKGRPWAAIAFEVVEHNRDGLKLLAATCARASITLASVPYNEPHGGNPHHHLFNLTEATFADLPGRVSLTRHPEAPFSLMIEVVKEIT